jgi:hypothetical protein
MRRGVVSSCFIRTSRALPPAKIFFPPVGQVKVKDGLDQRHASFELGQNNDNLDWILLVFSVPAGKFRSESFAITHVKA